MVEFEIFYKQQKFVISQNEIVYNIIHIWYFSDSLFNVRKLAFL